MENIITHIKGVTENPLQWTIKHKFWLNSKFICLLLGISMFENREKDPTEGKYKNYLYICTKYILFFKKSCVGLLIKCDWFLIFWAIVKIIFYRVFKKSLRYSAVHFQTCSFDFSGRLYLQQRARRLPQSLWNMEQIFMCLSNLNGRFVSDVNADFSKVNSAARGFFEDTARLPAVGDALVDLSAYICSNNAVSRCWAINLRLKARAWRIQKTILETLTVDWDMQVRLNGSSATYARALECDFLI